jgi:hypothetical protein
MRFLSKAKPSRRLRSAFILQLALLLGPVSEAHAYIDPGSTSFLLQAVIGAIAAAAIMIRHYGHRVTRMFRRNEERQSGDGGVESREGETGL